MEYINLTITQLSEAAYRRSSLADRGLWLTLLSYCVQQENRGRIGGAKNWNDWDCQQVLGVPRKDIDGEHLLWKLEGEDLVVAYYPLAKQKEVQAKRQAGKRGGISSGEARSRSAASSASSSADTERKGKEGKEKQKGNEGARRPRDLVEVIDYAQQLGATKLEAEKFFDHFEANGWRQGGRTPLRSWPAALRNWLRRGDEFGGKKARGAEAGAVGNPNQGLQIFEPVGAAAAGGGQ